MKEHNHASMTQPAPMLAPAERTYSGAMTRPERWATWSPRQGDIIVCTPPKCGTTWTQSILAMLAHGGSKLPEKIPLLSPWIDADLGLSADEVAKSLLAQKGRRVVKTHTPGDGFPFWEGVTVIAVYRHPLDAFFSLRTHIANRADPNVVNPLGGPISQAFATYINSPATLNDFDQDSLANLATHYSQTVLSGRSPKSKVFHYSDMLRNGRSAVQELAKAAEINADDSLIDEVTAATAFGAMKAKAADFAPAGGMGFWKSDANFFDSANSGKWEGVLTPEELESYRRRFKELIPDAAARAWLENGNGEAS